MNETRHIMIHDSAHNAPNEISVNVNKIIVPNIWLFGQHDVFKAWKIVDAASLLCNLAGYGSKHALRISIRNNDVSFGKRSRNRHWRSGNQDFLFSRTVENVQTIIYIFIGLIEVYE